MLSTDPWWIFHMSKELKLKCRGWETAGYWVQKYKRFRPWLTADLCLYVVTAVSLATSGSDVSTETWSGGNCAMPATGGSGASPRWLPVWWCCFCYCSWGCAGLRNTGDFASIGTFNLLLAPPRGFLRWAASTHLLHLKTGITVKENKKRSRISLL